MALKFALVCKAHGWVSIFMGLVLLAASFGWSLPWIGPEALLSGWDDGGVNAALTFVSRFLAGVLFGLGYFEVELADQETTRKVYVRYHIVLALLVVYSTFAVAVSWLSWLYSALVVLFLLGGLAGSDEGYRAI